MKLLTGILTFIFLSTLLQAQEKRQMANPREYTALQAEVIASNSSKVVRGAPFSAEAVSESVQMFADGNKITRTVKTQIYRDGEGRFRREQAPNLAGNLGSVINVQPTISIFDPVAGMQLLLNPSAKTARRFKLEPLNSQTMNGQTQFQTTVRTNQNRVNVQPNPISAINRAKTESLGIREIEGVKALGTRSTQTVAAGELGNDRAFDIVYERWYSEDLQEIILSVHTDPRFGVQTYRLINIKRDNPDKSLFALPAGYSVTDSKTQTYQINRNL